MRSAINIQQRCPVCNMTGFFKKNCQQEHRQLKAAEFSMTEVTLTCPNCDAEFLEPSADDTLSATQTCPPLPSASIAEESVLSYRKAFNLSPEQLAQLVTRFATAEPN